MEVHPVAALFPMLSDEELSDLADDIKANGLLYPIVRYQGMILDGRNRYSACILAGVTPRFVEYEGDDPDGYALSVNIARRHLSKGQIAMVAAKANFLVSKKFGAKQRIAKAHDVSNGRISQAIIIIQYAPELVDLVIAGHPGLDEAYETAKLRKTDADTYENQRAREAERHAKEAAAAAQKRADQLAALRQAAPDLADLVLEGRLTLVGAQAEATERQTTLRRHRKNATMRIVTGLKAFDQLLTEEQVIYTYNLLDFALAKEQGEEITPTRLQEGSAFLAMLARYIEQQQGEQNHGVE